MTASIGVTVYSWLVPTRVFVVTNSLMLVSAFVGLSIVLRHRHRTGFYRRQREGQPGAIRPFE